MRKFSFLSFLFFFSISILAQDVHIKSLLTYTGKDQINFPLISSGSNNSLKIEFDIESEDTPSLSIHFWFCDKNWEPYFDNVFLNNPLQNIDENLWLDQIPGAEFGANYHFKGSYPNRDIKFNFSGKWIYFITDAYDEEEVYASGKFLVIDNSIRPSVRLREVSINRSKRNENNALNRSYQISSSYTLPDSLDPFKVEEVQLIENRKFDYPIVIEKTISDYRSYEWDGSNNFTFIAKDVSPGNNYRQTNLMNTDRHYPPSTDAQLDGPETSNSYFLNNRDYLGASRLVKYDFDEARYMIVNFELSLDKKITQPVFLVGAFNNWLVLPEYEMNNDNGLHTISLELKRGIYDYQYVLADRYDFDIENIDWLTLEGNEYNANKEYHILIYYKTVEYGGYDKVIGFKRIRSANY